MSKNNESFIKNKKIFIAANILLVFIIILDAAGLSPSNQYLDAISELVVLMSVITMLFLSIKHSKIMKIVYGFSLFVCITLIIIACLLFFGVM